MAEHPAADDRIETGVVEANVAAEVRAGAEAKTPAASQQGTSKTVLCTGKVKVACLDVDSLRPKPIPGKINREIF